MSFRIETGAMPDDDDFVQPATRKGIESATEFWDRLNREAREAKSPREKQAATERIWNAATRRTGPGEPWPFPDSGYTTPAPDAPKPCAPGSWDAPAPVQRQGTPEAWPAASLPDDPPTDKPNTDADEWVAAPIARKLKW